MDLEAIPGFTGLGEAAVIVAALDGTFAAAHDDGRWRYPASMIKVPLAAALASDFASGRLDPADRKSVDPANLTPNDAPSPLEAGYSARLDELAALMIARSDNVATNELIDVVDRARVADLLAPVGLGDTHVRRKVSGADPLIDDPQATGRNSHPAADAARPLTAQPPFAAGPVPGRRDPPRPYPGAWRRPPAGRDGGTACRRCGSSTRRPASSSRSRR